MLTVIRPTAAEVKAARGAKGLTQAVCVGLFCCTFRTWQGKDLRHIDELLGHKTLLAMKRLIYTELLRFGALVAGVI